MANQVTLTASKEAQVSHLDNLELAYPGRNAPRVCSAGSSRPKSDLFAVETVIRACPPRAGFRLLHDDDFADGLGLSLRPHSPDKVHTRSQHPHIVRTRFQVEHLAPTDV
jgi:hypothetical protein